jgi:cyanophycinase-like exopeptidase
MIEVLEQTPQSDAEVLSRLARAKGIQLVGGSQKRIADLARDLIDRGFPVSDSFDAALNHVFSDSAEGSHAE